MSILRAENINTGYGKKQVLFDINIDVKQGECVLLIGSNGSGKSTLFKAIYKSLDLWDKKGKIFFNDEDISNLSTNQLIKKGIVYIPQKDELFEYLTVQENLELSILHLHNKKDSETRITSVLEQMPGLKLKLKQDVNNLSGGERKLVSFAMALLNKTLLLLYDEPLAGLSDEHKLKHIEYLKQVKENGTTLILIEHRIKELLPIVDRVIGLKLGNQNKKELNTIEQIKSFMI